MTDSEETMTDTIEQNDDNTNILESVTDNLEKNGSISEYPESFNPFDNDETNYTIESNKIGQSEIHELAKNILEEIIDKVIPDHEHKHKTENKHSQHDLTTNKKVKRQELCQSLEDLSKPFHNAQIVWKKEQNVTKCVSESDLRNAPQKPPRIFLNKKNKKPAPLPPNIRTRMNIKPPRSKSCIMSPVLEEYPEDFNPFAEFDETPPERYRWISD